MPVVAVPGGTGNLGRAIVNGLLDATIEVVIFARKLNIQSSPEPQKTSGARVVVVDYDDEDSLVSVLEENKIDTIISTLRPHGQGDGNPELVLIKAAERSSITKRYIPSVWGVHFTPETAAVFPPPKTKLALMEALKTTSLEWTAIANGFFTDFYVTPKVPSTMKPMPVFVDIESHSAALPGDGNVPVGFTHTTDVAKYVAALVTAPKWTHHESVIIGDKVTWNEFVTIAEDVTKTKFTVTYDSVEALQKGAITELPSYQKLYQFLPKEVLMGMLAAFGVMFDNGTFNLHPSAAQSLNQQFPTIKPKSVKELVHQAWGA